MLLYIFELKCEQLKNKNKNYYYSNFTYALTTQT